MGYTGIYGATRADVIAELTADNRYGKGSRCIAQALRGSVLYVVQELTAPSGSEPAGHRFIMVNLLGNSKEGAGYKDMSEVEGPYYHDCPLSFFDLVPNVPNEDAQKFRDQCRAKVAQKRNAPKNIAPGTKITLPEGYRVRFFEAVPTPVRRRGVFARALDSGKLYRIPATQLAQASIG